jgi:hypothetical protein
MKIAKIYRNITMRGQCMSRSLFAFILMACLVGVALGGFAPVANAASAGQSLPKPSGSLGTDVIEAKYRGRASRVYLPLGPTYLARDYPYYYSRGYYPTHIGPGYIYYGYPYAYSRAHYSRQGSRCSYWRRRCAANWGHGNEDYFGCMDHHGCD